METIHDSQYARSLIEASLDPLFTISPSGKITDMNNASVNITGVSREKLLGSNFFDYFTEPLNARKVYQEVFEKGFVADYPLTIRDGKLKDVLFNGSVYKDHNQNVIGAVVVARDISEQKRIEKEIIEARDFAELATEIAENAKTNAEKATMIAENATMIAGEAVKAKQQFLSNMSHEIRTPMNAIIGFTKVLLKTELTAKQNEYLMAIKLSGDSLIVLINDILDLAKVDAGKMTFEQSPFKLASSISTMLHLFEPKVQEQNLTLIKKYDSNIPDILLGDPVRLHQIIINLLSNAVKFTSKGYIKVSVEIISEDDDKINLCFTISDTGIGIPENKIDNIFENFQQATSGTSRLYGGTGLGLAIVKQLVESQGGTVTVKSEINQGSVFSFTLQFNKTKEMIEIELLPEDIDAENRTINILVVEDIPLNQLLMKTLIDEFGFKCDIVNNGEIAVEYLRTRTYDIVLMDLQMPVMNGFEATEYIRNVMNLKTPIIALTADVTTVDLAKCKAVGMNDYIAKPVDERLLYNKIVVLLKPAGKVKKSSTNTEDSKPTPKCTNLDYLTKRTKANPKLMMEMIMLYMEQIPPLVNEMKTSFEKKDWDTLHSAAHKLIPSFSIVGISSDYSEMAKQVQQYASDKHDPDEIKPLIDQLDDICSQACVELNIEYKLLNNKL